MARSLVLATTIVLLAVAPAAAIDYVPGSTRDGGIYVPPHFRSGDRPVHPAEAWFHVMQRDKAAIDQAKAPPAAAGGSPPAPPVAGDRHR